MVTQNAVADRWIQVDLRRYRVRMVAGECRVMGGMFGSGLGTVLPNCTRGSSAAALRLAIRVAEDGRRRIRAALDALPMPTLAVHGARPDLYSDRGT